MNRRTFPNCSLMAMLLCLAGTTFLCAQTYEIGGQDQQSKQAQQQTPAKKGKRSPQAGAAVQEGTGAWGSGIEFTRFLRKAEDEARRGNNAAAADYTRRALQEAPNNPDLWFMLGYTTRLSSKLSESEAAYQKGLQLKPNSADGLGGLAQTYMKMGRNDDAKRLLLQVIASNPRPDDLLMAGELFMQTGDTQRGMELLQRAEAVKPSAHAELLMAIGYMKLKDPQRAKQLLDMAKRRDPRNTDIFRAVANFYRETKDYQAAIDTLKNAPQQKPDVLADLGYTYELAGNKRDAASFYGRAANEEKGNIGYQLSAAQAELDLAGGKNDEEQGPLDKDALQKSRQYLARVAEANPNHYRLHAILASMAKRQGNNDEAIREYETAIANVPEAAAEGPLYPVLLRLNLSELYKEVGNDAAANQQFAIAEQQVSKLQIEGSPKAEFLRVRASIKTAGNDLEGAEKDLLEALQIDPNNLNIQLQYANLLWKQKRNDDARKIYLGILERNPKNAYALGALGYLARDANDTATAEKYFRQMAEAYPNDFVPYLAMGDMYTALYKFDAAQKNYQLAYERAAQNPSVLANGANAALEDRKLDLAKTWVERAQGLAAWDDPRVMRERERYLFLTGKYLESAQLGYRVLAKLPRDRNASVYLGYALYNLGRYDDVLALASRYENVLPKERDFPVLIGHVHKQGQLLNEAVEDYSRALQRDPTMVEAFVNRGYVLNDLQNPEAALADFNETFKIDPNNGSALLGAAFSNLQLHRARPALEQVARAEQVIGVNGPTHMVRATAYEQLRQLADAEREYRAALTFAPDDLALHKALADTLYHAHKYQESIGELNVALNLAPDDPYLYAQRSHAEAQLRMRDAAVRDVVLAEQQGSDQAGVLLATGDALFILGERDAAIARFTRALDAPDANRIDIRLAFARLFARDGKFDDAKQQISLGFTEARIGDASPATPENLIEAANIFLYMHDFDLAEKFYERGRESGSSEQQVALGLANTYLAQGDDLRAYDQVAGLTNSGDHQQDYEYMLTMAELYRSRHQMDSAITSYARANQLSARDESAALRGLLETAGDQGIPVRQDVRMMSDVSVAPIYQDSTVYQLDADLLNIQNPALVPRAHSSIETTLRSAVRYQPSGWMPLTGFVQLRNARGSAFVPSELLPVNRNTFDTSINGGINPMVRLFGNTKMTLNTGLQFTIRRDTESPVEMNQNLFRQFLYLTTTPFYNWLSVEGSAFHESGPFTERSLNSGEQGARIDFRVGRPWGKTALVTGYLVDDLQFNPLIREYFATSSYVGIERKFGQKVKVRGLAEYIRSWRVQDVEFARAQAFSPAATVEWRPNETWKVDGTFNYQSGRGQNFINHSYDNIQSGFLISYVKPLRQSAHDAIGPVPVEYPIRFSVGIQQQTFMNLAGRGQAIYRPVFRLTLF